MDYIFRWIQIRFLSGQQLDLFAGLSPHAAAPAAESVPVAGTVTAPENAVNLSAEASPTLLYGTPASEAPAPRSYSTVTGAIADLVGTSDFPDLTPQTILDREKRAQGGHVPLGDQDVFNNAPGSAPGMGSTTPPQGGIAPDLAANSGLSSSPQSPVPSPLLKDRGITGIPGTSNGPVHASDALSEIVDLRDSPSCATCGAIMTRSGSCYRCMSCGSTSGCS